jgi:hypothetical protein
MAEKITTGIILTGVIAVGGILSYLDEPNSHRNNSSIPILHKKFCTFQTWMIK